MTSRLFGRLDDVAGEHVDPPPRVGFFTDPALVGAFVVAAVCAFTGGRR